MYRPTNRMNQISKKYGVQIAWEDALEPIIDVRTNSMVVFHRIAAEMAWDHDLRNATMVMAGNAA